MSWERGTVRLLMQLPGGEYDAWPALLHDSGLLAIHHPPLGGDAAVLTHVPTGIRFPVVLPFMKQLRLAETLISRAPDWLESSDYDLISEQGKDGYLSALESELESEAAA